MGRRSKDKPARSHSSGAQARAVRRGPPVARGPVFPALAPVGALALVLLAGAWLQISALRLPFFADDYLFLDQVRGRSLWAALTSPDPLRNFWRPVGRQLYFWLVAQSGESAVVAHVLNFLIFLGIVAMLFVLARRLAGTRAALIAASVLALHYAADVPVRWASGSQDLIAVAGALGALCLLASGRRWWAALSLGIGLLAKETVVVTPLVGAWMMWRPGERWTRLLGRAWPLGAVVGAWAVAWAFAMHGRSGGTVHFSPDSIPAAPVHLLQVFLGAEWTPHQSSRFFQAPPPIVPVLLALVAIGSVRRRREADQPGVPGVTSAGPGVWSTGLVWAAAATLPIVVVVHIWSAYYYLFALCGLALMLGDLLGRRPLWIALGATALLAWGSESARRLETFATDPSPWCTGSHLNRFYFDRSMWWVTRYLQDLRRQRPTLPHRSTLFFSGLQFFSSWQAADGPLIRWAYRDSSLRSYYFHDLTAERARRGPFFVYMTRNDSLIEQKSGPDVLFSVAASQLASERYALAKDVLELARERYPGMCPAGYWLGWVEMALGDSAAAHRELAAAGFTLRPGSSPQTASARRLLAAGDTLGAINQLDAAIRSHVLDPEAHALLADILLVSSGSGVVEALAACRLTPRDPLVWRRWAILQMRAGNYQMAYPSMRRYFELAGPAARGDAQARQLLELIRQAQPGGELAQRALRRRPLTRD